MGGCAFLTNHAYVLACIAREPGTRLRDIADCAGITERAAHRIVGELEEEGFLTRHRMGARNFYEVHPNIQLREPLEGELSVGELLALLNGGASPSSREAA